MNIFLGIGFMVFSAVALGLLVGRYLADGHWHQRIIHKKCGFHTRYRLYDAPCERCGESNISANDIDTKTMRATFPLGWEEKEG